MNKTNNKKEGMGGVFLILTLIISFFLANVGFFSGSLLLTTIAGGVFAIALVVLGIKVINDNSDDDGGWIPTIYGC